jgi:hypothetical protein
MTPAAYVMQGGRRCGAAGGGFSAARVLPGAGRGRAAAGPHRRQPGGRHPEVRVPGLSDRLGFLSAGLPVRMEGQTTDLKFEQQGATPVEDIEESNLLPLQNDRDHLQSCHVI